MTARDRLDPESREVLDQLLLALPGGLNSIRDIRERRSVAREQTAALLSTLPPNDRVTSEDLLVPGPDGAPAVPVRVYTPADRWATRSGLPGLPGIFCIHGGGMVFGDIDAVHLTAQMLCDRVGAIVVSTGYRKAPEDPHPAQVQDCFAALRWMADTAEDLGIDRDRIAIYGGSAGGNLCISTAMLARDRGAPAVRFMLAAYPMLDDRNDTPSSHEITDIGVWDRAASLEAWEWFLGGQPADAYAAPARATDLAGLPPAFIDVGNMDLFRDEDIAFALRLVQSGVPTEFHLYAGAYHASENIAPSAALSQRIWESRIGALRRALHP